MLPKELVTHILSFLDAASLISSELVCRRWHEFAVDPLVWREIFFSDFLSQIPSLPDTFDSFQYRDSGVGKLDPGQDWKLMWKTRKSLNQRWSEGYAAAVYLEGHSDSVYCVQFDEYAVYVCGTRIDSANSV